MNTDTGALPGVMSITPPVKPTPSAAQATPPLLELARAFDAAPAERIEDRIAIGELMKQQMGDRAGEFDTRFAALSEKSPKFPWPAESLVRGMGFVPREQAFTGKAGAVACGVRPLRFLSDEKNVLLDCGCASDGSKRILVCDGHREEVEAREAPAQQAKK